LPQWASPDKRIKKAIKLHFLHNLCVFTDTPKHRLRAAQAVLGLA
jgi:hypothetical protein